MQKMMVVLDEINGKIDRLGEGHGAMAKKMDGLVERMDRMEREMVTKADLKIVLDLTKTELIQKIDGTNQRIDRVGKNLGDVEKNLGDKIDGLGQRLVTVEAR